MRVVLADDENDFLSGALMPETPMETPFYAVEIDGEWHCLYRDPKRKDHFLSVARFYSRERAEQYADIENDMHYDTDDTSKDWAKDLGTLNPINAPPSHGIKDIERRVTRSMTLTESTVVRERDAYDEVPIAAVADALAPDGPFVDGYAPMDIRPEHMATTSPPPMRQASEPLLPKDGPKTTPGRRKLSDAAFPTCEKCGGPRSIGSAKMCRDCYRKGVEACERAVSEPPGDSIGGKPLPHGTPGAIVIDMLTEAGAAGCKPSDLRVQSGVEPMMFKKMMEAFMAAGTVRRDTGAAGEGVRYRIVPKSDLPTAANIS